MTGCFEGNVNPSEKKLIAGKFQDVVISLSQDEFK